MSKQDLEKKCEKKDNVGLGVDIVSVERMKKILKDTPNFIEFTYTQNEIEYCKKTTRWAEHFATHFAAKEAVLKALGCGFFRDAVPKDVEVMHDAKGKPYVEIKNRVKEIAEKNQIKEIPISLSFTNNDAVAVAIALSDATSFQQEVLNKVKDPLAELTKQFKEAKKILSEDISNNNNEKDQTK